MGFLDKFPGAGTSAPGGDDWAKQAADAQAAADEILKNSGYAGGTADPAAMDVGQLSADRAAIEAQAHEQNRILGVGSPATLTLMSKVDTGETAGGNPIYVLELKVEPEGGTAYTVKKKEIIPSTTLASYSDGMTSVGRIDPADKNLVAFGDKPFM
ncbi:MAG: hypothetical protein EPN91_04385 [Salinibacterium sp.]|nr:MAG: hypothetical protein EPN91_04385 [Salinibacterium sp.]